MADLTSSDPGTGRPRRFLGVRTALIVGAAVALVAVAIVLTVPGLDGGKATPRAGPTASPGASASTPVARAVVASATWTRGASLPAEAAARWDAAVAPFPPAGQVILFGGAPLRTGDPWRNDTWILGQKGAWTKGAAAPSGLTPRGGAAMAYDPSLRSLVLFGGSTSSWPPLADTWLFDGHTWRKGPASPEDMLGRAGAGAVYDPAIERLVLFGGSGARPFDDTWLFDGSAWTKGPPAPSGMQPRAYFGMAYDPELRCVVVAGGDASTDTWLFDGVAWRHGPALPEAAGARERVRMVYDPKLGGDVLVGGIGPTSARADAWLLRDGAWMQIRRAGRSWPGARLDGALVWIDQPGVLGLVGGVRGVGFGTSTYRETWMMHGSVEPASSAVPSPAPSSSAAPAAPTPSAASSSNPSFDANAQVRAVPTGFRVRARPIVFHGVSVRAGCCSDRDFAAMRSLGLNLVRLRFSWAEVEPNPPHPDGHGGWVHAYDPGYLATIDRDIRLAGEHDLYVMLSSRGCRCAYFRFPRWLYETPYNSHHVTYPKTGAGQIRAATDLWSDPLRQSFMSAMLAAVAERLRDVPGVVGYELLNEPQPGTLPKTHATTGTILRWELSAAKAVRAADPKRIVFFETRYGYGPGLAAADLHGFADLGNVAFDLHDYFGARWGTGLVRDGSAASDDEETQLLFDHVLDGSVAYLGTTEAQVQFVRGRMEALARYGIPLLVGEFGDTAKDPGVANYYGTCTAAFTSLGVGWTVSDFESGDGILGANGDRLPWTSILEGAARR